MTVDPSLAARLRDVLSDEVFKAAGDRSSQAYLAEKSRNAASDVAERAHKDAYRDALIDALVPFVSSLLEAREREIREGLKRKPRKPKQPPPDLLVTCDCGARWAGKYALSVTIDSHRERELQGNKLGCRVHVERDPAGLLSRLTSSSSPAAPQEQK